jgi:4a-hydroxytetrahydrobiopterin dehydratase
MWQQTKDGLYKKFEFADFAQAFEFMTRVAAIAEGVTHHPRWTNEYGTVEIWLRTHSAGDTVTDKDKDLATAIGRVASEYIA